MNHTLRIIPYFTTWGTIYGLIIGLLSGATAWIIGAQSGIVSGAMLGVSLGCALGLVTALIQRLTFHSDIDLVLYRRCLAAFNGLLAFIVSFCGLLIVLIVALQHPPRSYELADFYPIIAIFIPKTVILTALCVAYISIHYPDWIIREFYSPDPLPEPYSVQKSVMALVARMDKPPHTTIALALGMGFYLTEILSSEGIALNGVGVIIGQLLQSVAWSSMTMMLVILYLIVANAVLLTFLKRLFFDEGLIELSTYHYKSVMTIISFLFTVLMTSWYWVFGSVQMYLFNGFFSTPQNMHPVGKVAPIILGLMMAFYVSNTLALDTDEKAKHKEKQHELTTL